MERMLSESLATQPACGSPESLGTGGLRPPPTHCVRICMLTVTLWPPQAYVQQPTSRKGWGLSDSPEVSRLMKLTHDPLSGPSLPVLPNRSPNADAPPASSSPTRALRNPRDPSALNNQGP